MKKILFTQGKFDKTISYPLYQMDRVEYDGPKRLIQIYLPDSIGEFTAKSKTVWVREEEVRVINKQIVYDKILVGKSPDSKLW